MGNGFESSTAPLWPLSQIRLSCIDHWVSRISEAISANELLWFGANSSSLVSSQWHSIFLSFLLTWCQFCVCRLGQPGVFLGHCWPNIPLQCFLSVTSPTPDPDTISQVSIISLTYLENFWDSTEISIIHHHHDHHDHHHHHYHHNHVGRVGGVCEFSQAATSSTICNASNHEIMMMMMMTIVIIIILIIIMTIFVASSAFANWTFDFWMSEFLCISFDISGT